MRKIADLFTQICNSIELKSRERVQKENFVNGLKTGVSLCFSDITEEALVLVLLYHINARIEYYLNSDSKKIDSIFKKSAQYYTPIPCDDIKDKSLVEKFNSARFGLGMTLSGISSYTLMNYFKLDHVKYISP